MKKKTILMMLCLGMSIFTLAGCGKDKTDATSTSQEDEIPITDEEDVLKCVELGDYKGLALTKTVTPVTDEDVDAEIASKYGNTTITEGPCQEGDTVYIAYVGTLDGVAFDGGSTDGTYITLGSSGYIDGFDAGVIGMKVGETKDLNLTFPDPYENNEELSGKDVVFSVTLNSISRAFDELTEEWVQTYTDSANIEEYRALIRKQLEEETAESDTSEFKNTVWSQVLESCTVKQYQQAEIDSAKELMQSYFEQYAAMMGTDLEGYLEMSGMTEEEYETKLMAAAKETAKSNMVLWAIVKVEGLSEEDEAYQAYLDQTAQTYGVTIEELIEANGEDQISLYVMSNCVMDLILDSATITETQADTTSETAE